MILTTSEESRLLDQRAMTEYGLPESVLMETLALPWCSL